MTGGNTQTLTLAVVLRDDDSARGDVSEEKKTVNRMNGKYEKNMVNELTTASTNGWKTGNKKKCEKNAVSKEPHHRNYVLSFWFHCFPPSYGVNRINCVGRACRLQ